LFIQSLPSGCKFGILSFGNIQSWSSGGSIIDYNNDTKENAIAEVMNFAADHGGTDILTPLKMVSEIESEEYKKRIFILTDG